MLKILVLFSILCFFLIFNYYIFYRLNVLFSLRFGLKFKLIGIFLGIFSIIFLIWHSHTYKFFYYFSAFWIGISFIAFSVLFLEHTIHNFLPFKYTHIVFFTFSLIFILVLYSLLNGIFSMEIKKIEIKTNKINKEIRAVLITDTHINRFNSKNYSEKLVIKILEQKPDFILISGDFIEDKVKKEVLLPFENIEIPIFFVLGNHEFYVNKNGEITKIFKGSKIKLIELGDKYSLGQIEIRGANYNQSKSFTLESKFKEMILDKTKYNIFLNHEPKFIELLEKKGFDLILSGHTHSGQIMPFGSIVKLAYKYFRGLYTYKNMKIYVSQGTGTWGPPMRVGSKNEITVIDFTKD